jgi:hypothetical protein
MKTQPRGYRTIIGSGNPQTLVWRAQTLARRARFDSPEVISRLPYPDFVDNDDVMHNASEELALELCLGDLAA